MTKAKSNVVSDFVAPIAVLVIICVVMSCLLALTNNATAPIIEEAERKAKEEARMEVLPEADKFLQVEIAGLPASVTEVFQAENGAGYTFSLTTQGYGGKNTLKLAVGIDMDGRITGTKVLDHKETAGLGSKITTDAFQGQFPGKNRGLEGVDNISGATFSSNYFRAAIADAYTAFDLVNG